MECRRRLHSCGWSGAVAPTVARSRARLSSYSSSFKRCTSCKYQQQKHTGSAKGRAAEAVRGCDLNTQHWLQTLAPAPEADRLLCCLCFISWSFAGTHRQDMAAAVVTTASRVESARRRYKCRHQPYLCGRRALRGIVRPALLCQSHVGRWAAGRERGAQAPIAHAHHQIALQQALERPVTGQQLPHCTASTAGTGEQPGC